MWLLRNKTARDAAAARLFGDVPPKRAGQKPKPYRSDQYQKQLGIDINELTTFYAEVGHADAPIGPVTPATERLPITPVLAIRKSQRGGYYVHGLSSSKGFFNRDKTKAWIKTEIYDQMVGDDYFDKVQARINQVLEEAEGSDSTKPLRLIDLNKLNEQERKLFDKLGRKDFGELTPEERAIVEDVLQREEE